MFTFMPLIIFLFLLIVLIALIVANIRIVPQTENWIIERLGKYQTTWREGLHCKVPFIDRIVNKVSTKEKVYDFPPQAVITKDNVTIHIDTVVYSIVTDARLYTYGTDNPPFATEILAATTLRNIVGSMELDTTLTSREKINDDMRIIIDEATDQWGIKVKRVEVKTIQPPKDIQDAMEQQMKAERTKRAKILEAEGEKRSEILKAEGIKESMILRAEGEKEAKILSAAALKRSKELEAEGEAYATIKNQEAYAQSIERLNEAKPTMEVLQLKAYDTMTNMADGNASKLIIPTELTNMSRVVASIKKIAEFAESDTTDKALNAEKNISNKEKKR